MGLAEYLSRPDVRRAPMRLMSRRVLFEAARRLAPSQLRRERIIPFDDTLRMVVTPADAIERSIYLFGYHEYAAVAAFSSLVRPGMVVVDAGAHAGQFSLLAAKRVGKSGRVYAFEPHPLAHARLVRNVKLNNFDNVRAEMLALSDATGAVTLHVPHWAGDNTGVASLRDRGTDAQSIEVRATRLDDMLQDESRLDVMKVDVEGAEPALFAGAYETIARFKPAILFEANDAWERGSIDVPAVNALTHQGYEIFGIEAGRSVHLRRIAPGEDPRPFREAWQALNLVALHPDVVTNHVV